MKPTKLAIAMSLALAGMSGQTMAAAPANPLTTAAQIDVYLSGASAPQATLGALAATLFGENSVAGGCAATDNPATTTVNEKFCNFHVLYNTVGTIGADYRAYYGALQSAFTINGRTLSAGTTVLLTNRARGGSVHGVNPVALSFPIATMPVNTGCTFIAGDVNAYNYTCPPSGTDGTSGRRPEFGVSDVAPYMFKAPYNKEPGAAAIFNALSSAEVARLNNGGNGKAVFALQFGVPATNSVPATLTTTNGSPVTGFTKAMYSALLTGGIADWSQIDSTINTGNTGVVICRRSQGSGTQATYNAYFNNFPCTVNSVIPGSDTAPARMEGSFGISAFTLGGTDPITIDPTAGFTVVENPSSGNVRDCLWRAQTNQNHTYNWTDDLGGIHAVTVQFANTPATPFRAIGVLSNDSTEGQNGANNSGGHWTFRELNDVSGMDRSVVPNLPSKAAVRTGKWDFASEVTMQYRVDGYINTAGNFVAGAVPAGVETQRRDFIDLFIQRAGDPAILNTIASSVTRAASVALPSAVNNPSTNNNVAFVTRNGNMCAPNQWVGF